MNWLARLKKIDTAPKVEATEPTKPGFVGFVAPGMAPMQKTGVDSPAANDAAEVPELVSSGEVASSAVATLVSSPAALFDDPDRWAWPHSQAMTGCEIDLMAERARLFSLRGLGSLEAELLADRLVTRDREGDDRRLCMECAHLSGRAGAMRCTEHQRAGLGAPGLPAGLALQLQRCDGFKA